MPLGTARGREEGLAGSVLSAQSETAGRGEGQCRREGGERPAQPPTEGR